MAHLSSFLVCEKKGNKILSSEYMEHFWEVNQNERSPILSLTVKKRYIHETKKAKENVEHDVKKYKYIPNYLFLFI